MSSGSLRPRPSTYPSVLTQTSMRIDKDEELGKRDDDFRSKPRASPAYTDMGLQWHWRKRRIFAILTALALVYVFVKNIPTDLGPWAQRPGMVNGGQQLPQAAALQERMNPLGGGDREPTGPPPRDAVIDDEESDSSMWYYDGPLIYYLLASSLQGVVRMMGQRPSNRNVLFAVSSLKSAANLMPMACEMARWNRNYVHMVLLGRDPLPLEDILEVNGVNRRECLVYFHDGRPNYSAYSSNRRAESSVAGAMKHVNDFMHPQAMIMDDSSKEDEFFTRAMRAEARKYGRPLIEIPAGKYEEFFWVTRLDSGSLSNWFRPTIDILIDAPAGSSGSLIRLIYSLHDADYSGLRQPRLTINLPSDIEPSLQRRLGYLDWPPGYNPDPIKLSAQTLHHRIPNEKLGSEQASVRFLEAWWPAKRYDNHVLVLSPQAEIGPLFLQYLHYTILEYKYSSYGSSESDRLLGISLDLPSTFLNGSDGFEPPKFKDANAHRHPDDSQYDREGPVPFLYEAPSATASLIFGDKWVTLHDFLSKRLSSSHAGKAQKTKKLVSETEPAWLEYLLELMRARRYTMLMPAFPFATIHNELAQIPEEFLRDPEEDKNTNDEVETKLPSEQEPFLTADSTPALPERKERETRGHAFLHDYLPSSAELPELHDLPYLTHEASYSNSADALTASEAYATEFREKIGGCTGRDATEKRVVRDMLVTDELFCLPGIEVVFDLENRNEQEDVAKQIMAETAPEASPVVDEGVDVRGDEAKEGTGKEDEVEDEVEDEAEDEVEDEVGYEVEDGVGGVD
ncbi:hypothetical protein EJ03DRAFT_331043 [Teratosphaeria nubilosa]|uniref:Uncharacterized protein n=1 Tax=Teratosphaeria nubilosa TaxID=161662 RepID=A0A6G1KXL2_9PEZI|nr:hypothetical protein EJ03DRAFT_331043 [Teratosphaeria nubilosa]